MLFRDYGLYDHAMLRFSKGHKISDNFYVRQDGTRAYYFSEGLILTRCQLALSTRQAVSFSEHSDISTKVSILCAQFGTIDIIQWNLSIKDVHIRNTSILRTQLLVPIQCLLLY